MKKLMLVFATFALALATAASSYTVNVGDPTWVAGKELQPGDYKVQIDGNKVTLKSGKNVIEVPGKVESTDRKFDTTAIVSQTENGKLKMSEIRLGGTKTKIVIDTTQNTAGGTN